MKLTSSIVLALPLFAGLSSALVASEIPTQAEADVVVVGGTVRAVVAAVEARKSGAEVCLVAPRPYLGDDLSGRLLLERGAIALPGDLARTIYDPSGYAGAVTFGDTTPLRVKKTLDEQLLSNGIWFRTWTFASDVLRGADGSVVGVVTSSKDGLSFIRAKVVVDATDGGWIASHAGLEREKPKGGELRVARRLIAGENPPQVAVRTVGAEKSVPVDTRGEKQINQPAAIVARLLEAEFTVPAKDLSARALAEIEQKARDLTWVPSQVEAADNVRIDLPGFPEARKGFVLFARGDGVATGREAAALARSRKTLPASADYREKLPTIASCDVFVVGAGTGGAPAAIAAARTGAKVIVSDYLWRMGGVMTEGVIGSYCFGLKVGFTAEADPAVARFGSIYSQCKAEWMRREARKAGAEIWFGSLVNGVVREGEALSGVIVTMADGSRGIVRAKAVVDATGNADVAALAGEETEFLNADELSVQGAGSTPRILGASYQNTDSGFVDDGDATDLFYFSLRARSCFGSYAWDQSQVVNTRERRRLHGVAYITAQDVMNNRTYSDVVVQTRSNFDTHGQTVSEQFFIQAPHASEPITVNVPYRAFLPRRVDGLLVIGLGMSAHRDAMPILRMQADVQNQGYAAGFAAATAVRDGVRVRDVDIRKVQHHLVEKGVVPAKVLDWKDSFPLADDVVAGAVRTLPDRYKGLSQVLADPARALPLLRDAHAAAADADAKLVYAHVLGLCGDAAGAETLLAHLAKTKAWDKGWNFKGMDQFGRSVSWVDSYMIALGRTGDRRALEPVLRLARLLEPKDAYSHFRAVALAAESLGDPSAAETLAGLLAKPGIGGRSIAFPDLPRIPKYDVYSRRNLGVADKERSDCLRELCLARALYRCGDFNGVGRRTLEAYAADPRRMYAKHAKMVLNGKKTDSQ